MGLRVGIIQPNFIPWRGYFDFIDDVDVFILLDDVQYTKNDWRNRNKIKTKDGPKWLTVPVRHHFGQLIQDAEIDNTSDWAAYHLRLLQLNYERAEFMELIAGEYREIVSRSKAKIADLARETILWVCRHLEISARIVTSSEIVQPATSADRSARLLELIRIVGGNAYLSGPAALSYLDIEAFRSAGVKLEIKSYDYEPYPQLWESFDGAVSILDLLMNVGPEARKYIKSNRPNETIC